MQDSETWDTNW